MRLQRPGYIFGVIALLVASGVAWLLVDAPVTSGVGILGAVEYCKTLVTNMETAPTSCQVFIAGQDKRVWVYMPGAPPGHKLRLKAIRRALTGRRYYVVDYAAKP